jgi:hypothetical protein
LPRASLEQERMFSRAQNTQPGNAQNAPKSCEDPPGVFDSYLHTGAYAELLAMLLASREEPRFDFTIKGVIGDQVPFLGKPDLRFVPDLGHGPFHCIFDWKVKGYCSEYGASPSKGYMICLDGFKAEKASRSHGKEHGMFLAMDFRGFTINSGYMEFCNDEYADQLCLYGWLLGEQIGDENVVLGIEELCAKFMGEGNPPTLRYARHRGRVKADYQAKLAERVTTCWQAITSGHVFTAMTRKESDARRAPAHPPGLSQANPTHGCRGV